MGMSWGTYTDALCVVSECVVSASVGVVSVWVLYCAVLIAGSKPISLQRARQQRGATRPARVSWTKSKCYSNF